MTARLFTLAEIDATIEALNDFILGCQLEAMANALENLFE
jgi:hypothetical protein